MENDMHHQFEREMLIDKIKELVGNNFRILRDMKLNDGKSAIGIDKIMDDRDELLKNCLSDINAYLEEYGLYFCYEGCKYYISQLGRIIIDTSYKDEYYNALLMLRTSLLAIRKLLADEIFRPGDIESTKVIFRNCAENYGDFITKLLMNNFSSTDKYIIFVKQSITAHILSKIIKACLNEIDSKTVVDFTIGSSPHPLKNFKEEVDRNRNKKVMANFRSGDISILVVSNVLKEDIDMPDCNEIHFYDFPETFRSHVQNEGRATHSRTKDEQYWFPNWQINEKKSSIKEVYIKIPKYFEKCRPLANQNCYLHVIKINAENLKPTTCRRKVCAGLLNSPNELGIITRNPIPEVCDFPVCSDLGEVIINIETNHRTLKLNEQEIIAVSEFHRTLFLKAIQVVKSFLMYSKDPDEPMGYFIVPLKPNEDKNGMQIAFEVVPNQYAIPDIREPSVKERAKGEYSKENYRLSVVLPWYRKHCVEGTEYYVITDVDANKTTRSPFPNRKFSSYADYYEKRYGLTTLQPDQPLLKARRIPLDLNFQPRETFGDEHENDEYLVAEFCMKLLFPSDYWYKSTILPTILYRLHYLLLAQELKEKFANDGGIGVQKWDKGDSGILDDCRKLSSTQQFVGFKEGSYYQIETSKKGQSDKVHENKGNSVGCFSSPPPLMVLKEYINYEGPKQEELLEALTTKKSNDTVDLERLEILGDSFIKFAVSFTIFVKCPEQSEGFLTNLKGRLIGNQHLMHCGNNLNFGSFINVNNFKTRMNYWSAPGFVRYKTGNRPSAIFHTKIPLAEQFSGTLSIDTICSINADVDKFESDSFDKSKSEKKENEALLFYGKQVFGDKTIADVVEALTGLYVKTGGIKSAYKLLNYFGTIANPTYEEIMDTRVSSPLIKRRKFNVDDLILGYKTLEKRLSYEFNDKTYIVLAMTPASYRKNHDMPVCYERLEFVGDAILDFLVTSYIFEYCGNLPPGKITDLRSSLVNNTTFGALCVRLGFHEFLLADDDGLTSSIKYFEAYQNERNHEIYGNEMMVEISNGPIKMAEEVKVPKVLGDIFESLAGAIFIDSGNNLNEVWRVYYNIMRKEIGVEYFRFLGIPYGQSTAGHARFKDPVKIKPWKDVLDCTIEKDGCLQFSMRSKELIGSEDCLYNNIYIPKIPTKDEPLKAVIVCYHPGGLAHGSPDPWNYGSPEYIMHHDVVYVCVAFRLHILGFLNLGLKECSGNQGLKDVLLSLQWIKENIQVFGGDPENITIMGSGTGAGIVHDLMIIPKAKGLFHKALLMGMYKSCPLHLAPEENASLAFDIATGLDYPKANTDKKKLLSFYKALDLKDIFVWKPDLFIRMDKSSLFITSHFVTTPDSGEMAVVPPLSRQQQIQSTARIPIMVGFCEREASMGLSAFYKKGTMKDVYGLIRSNYFGWGYNLSDDKIKLIQKRVEEFYLGGKSIENAPLSTKCDILTDAALSDVYDSLINVIAESDPPSSVFVYKFNFEGNAFTLNEYIASKLDEPLKGACHEADFNHWANTEYRWGNKTDSLTPETCEVIENFTKYITTFAKTGNPNSESAPVQWEPSTIENPRYLYIGDTLQMVPEKLNGKRLEFWEHLKYECLKE